MFKALWLAIVRIFGKQEQIEYTPTAPMTFKGLQFGVSTPEEALQIMRTLNICDKVSASETDELDFGDTTYIGMLHFKGFVASADVHFWYGKLSFVNLRIGKKDNAITFMTALELKYDRKFDYSPNSESQVFFNMYFRNGKICVYRNMRNDSYHFKFYSNYLEDCRIRYEDEKRDIHRQLARDISEKI